MTPPGNERNLEVTFGGFSSAGNKSENQTPSPPGTIVKQRLP